MLLGVGGGAPGAPGPSSIKSRVSLLDDSCALCETTHNHPEQSSSRLQLVSSYSSTLCSWSLTTLLPDHILNITTHTNYPTNGSLQKTASSFMCRNFISFV